jgi:tetratricopeptide (TPR) repeat protein
LVELDARRGAILARSGNGRAALPILEAVAASRFSDRDHWRLAAVVAAGIGDHAAHRRLSRIASLRFVSSAEGTAAAGVAWGLNQLPTDEATLAVTRAMLERVAQSADGISTAFSPIVGAVLAYRERRYDEALLLLDQFQSATPTRPKWVTYYIELPGQRAACAFLRAMIHAQLGRIDEARQAYAQAEAYLKETLGDPPRGDRGVDWDRSYQAEARQREARELFRAKGIPLPEPRTR